MLKFKSRSDLLVEEYQKPSIPEERMYVIDKVVRMRGLQGRYGVDHSEILNYEFEQANKARSNHINMLVYKNPVGQHEEGNKIPQLNKMRSNALFERLTEKEIEEMKREGGLELL